MFFPHHCQAISQWTCISKSELMKERYFNLILKMKHQKCEIALLT